MTDTPQVEEELARRYRQPKGVEQFGAEPIPDELRTVRWWDIFAMVLNFVVNPGTIVISGALVAAGMSLWEATLTGFLSILVGFSVYLVAATVGVDYGIPGLVSMRAVFGTRGAGATSVLRALSSVYWFAFQTVSGGVGIAAVLRALFDTKISLNVIIVCFAVFQILVATVGYNSLKSLSRVAFVLKIAFSAVIVVVLMTYPQSSYHPDAVFAFAGTGHGKVALIALWTTSMAAAWFSNFTDAADFCRYSRTRVDMWVGTFLAAVVGQLICSFIGGYAVAAVLGKTDSAFDVIVTATQGSVWLLVLILVYIVLDNWTINVQNLYTAGLAVTTLLSRVGRFWGTLAVGLVGLGVSLAPGLVSHYTDYMGKLADLFAPMAGVFVAHYVILLRTRLDRPALFETDSRYAYWQGYNWIALFWVVVGYFINGAVPEKYINIVVTAVATGALYLITMLIARRRWPVVAAGSEPVHVMERPVPTPADRATV
ncbi:cytosine permease [Actinomadura barringtoniae]|uniref:Cytosine permease n=1 Tax=Actinomadura barringtoniae TaxID=1427535 RepID=A0A939T762_9ACTN|nr:cytosine permease [Actinomadura barringtoniae]MBO2455736.1 cytosine permease [Actinomadura barringtoniae]